MIKDCSVVVDLLRGRVVPNGPVQMSDPARKLARSLLAAQLNIGAKACYNSDITSAVSDSIKLLTKYGFTGSSASNPWIPKADATSTKAANYLAGYLDSWNNHMCPPPKYVKPAGV